MTWEEYNDAYSRAVFLQFKQILEPALPNLMPGCVLHHIELRRRNDNQTGVQEIAIQLLIRPISQVKKADDFADLLTGPKRLEG